MVKVKTVMLVSCCRKDAVVLLARHRCLGLAYIITVVESGHLFVVMSSKLCAQSSSHSSEKYYVAYQGISSGRLFIPSLTHSSHRKRSGAMG